MPIRTCTVLRGSAPARRILIVIAVLLVAVSPDSLCDLCRLHTAAFTADDSERERASPATPHSGIREIVPDKYLKKYQRWKAEYLSTEVGRRQWARYADDKSFTLTIIVSHELGQGGLVDDYRWDAYGKLLAATIRLGCDFDTGVVSPFFYPVTGALASLNGPDRVRGEVLAAAKLAHEFGHVNLVAEADASSYMLQTSLIDLYAKVFTENGYDKNDPRLVELVRRMGGKPLDIKKEREHGAEANALAYLEERMPKRRGDTALFGKIRRYINEYAEGNLHFSR